MKVLKPDWINHNGRPIYSIDIHPDGSRLATGGQGEDSGRVIIWNMAPIVHESEEAKESVPRMLCQLDNHLACVNCVRWSGSGRYLASGGDDKLVMIWTRHSSGANSIFGSGAVNVEGWRCAYTLRAHQGDVLDMAWAPHDHYLATCSVDNTIIIWRPDNFPEIVTVLKGHTGLVKGVSWDPVGKYLGSQSDDKTVRIWRTVDWSQEKVISQPFEQCSGTTLVLRLSWSPDGQYLVTAHAMNSGGPTAKIIDRDGWSCKRDIVGHRKAVSCVRYSRRLTEKERSKGKVSQSSILGVGSRDRGVSVWICSSPRPLVVIEDLFSSPVLDLAWGPAGNILAACSGDGSTAFIVFTPAEIGRPLSEAEKDRVLERLYGKSDLLEAGEGLQVVENPAFLSVFSTSSSSALPPKEQHSSKSIKGTTTESTTTTAAAVVTNGLSSAQQNNNSQQSSGKPVTAATASVQPQLTSATPPVTAIKQIETRTSDGRRRITPIFIPLTQDNTEEIVPFSSDTMPSFSSCQKSRIIVERRDDVIVPPNVTPMKVTPPNTSSQISFLSTPNTQLTSPSVTESGGFTGLVCTSEKLLTTEAACGGGEGGAGSKRPAAGGDSTPKIGRKKAKRRSTEGGGGGDEEARPTGGHQLQGAATTGSAPPGGYYSLATAARLLPPLPPLGSTIIRLMRSKNFIRIENDVQKSANGNISVIKLESPEDSKPIWELALGGEVVSCSGTERVTVLASSDASLRLLSSRSGQPLLPPIALPGPPAVVKLSAGYLLVVTATGRLSVWALSDLSAPPRALLSNQDLLPLAPPTGELRIKECFVNEAGEPLIAFSGKAYYYSNAHNAWLLVGNHNDPVCRGTLATFRSQPPAASGASSSVGTSPLKSVQTAALNGVWSGGGRLVGPTSELAPLCTLSYLEGQLASALALRSSVEYKFWLLAQARFLVQRGLESRLKRLCESLLGPMYSTSSKINSKWEQEILGLKKHSLLEEILNEAKGNVKLQRLVMEMREQLVSKISMPTI